MFRRLVTLALTLVLAAIAPPLALPQPAAADQAGPAVPIPVMTGADINPGIGGLRSVGEIVPFGNAVFFVGDDGEHGLELWLLDPSTQTARMVRDINPDPDAPGPYQLTVFNGVLFFVADDGQHGFELWKSDGTESGTVLLNDINRGPRGSYIGEFVPFRDFLWFTATNEARPSEGAQLYRTRGASIETTHPFVDDIYRVGHVVAIDSHLFFGGCRAATGCELWRYSTNNNLSVYDFLAGSGSSWAEPLVAAAGTLYFGLYVQDERRLARLVDPNAVAGANQLDLLPSAFNATIGVSYSPTAEAAWFVATTPSHAERAVWVVPNRSSNQARRLTTGPVEPQGLVATAPGIVLFSAEHATLGRELFGASTGEVEVLADIEPGRGSSHPRGFVRTPTGVLTWAARGGREQLFSIGADGTATPVGGVAPRDFAGSDGERIVVPSPNGFLHAGRQPGNRALWIRTVGGAGQASVAAPAMPVGGGGHGSLPLGFAPFDGGVVTGASNGTSDHEPWLIRPGAAGPISLLDPASPERPTLTISPTRAGARLFFLGWRGLHNELSLWTATPGGQARVVSHDPGGPGLQVAASSGLAVLGERVVFSGDPAAGAPSSGAEPWVSDGSAAGTRPLADINPGAGGSHPSALTNVGSRVVFAATPAPGTHALWSTDGTPAGTASVAPLPADVHVAIAAGGRAWLALGDGGLWVSDGTAAGTRRVALGDDPAASVPVVSVGAGAGKVYAWGDEGLWQVDLATGASTKLDLAAGVFPLLHVGAANADAFVFPAATRSATEFFAIRGGKVVALGVEAPASAAGAVAHHGHVYLLGSRPDAGAEVWRTNGTPAGTVPVTDFSAPGTGAARRFGLTSATLIGDQLWFAADTDGRGIEPRYIVLAAEPEPGKPGNPGDPGRPGGGIVPVEPARYWDSRDSATFDGQFRHTGRMAGGTTYAVQIAGRGNVPAGATAAAVNLTAVVPDGPGFATLYPCGDTVPKASHLNYLPGDVLANAAIVPLDTTGKVCVYTKAGADYVLDVNGYADPAAPPLGVEPARYLDTRRAPGNPTFDGIGQGTGPADARTAVRVQIAGRGAVPAGATAAIVNVTAVGPEDAGFLTVYPCTDTVPRTSTVNYATGQVVPNGAVADLAPDGSLCIFTRAGTDIVVDVAGYLTDATRGVKTAQPARLFDSRPGEPLADGIATGPRPGAGAVVEIQVAGRGGVPLGATAAFLNVIAVGPDAPGYVTLFPCAATRPGTSNVNYLAGVVRANNALTKLSDNGAVCAFTLAATDLVLDVTGWLE
ncbi:MAG TPA: ELWxxDGT repeat protein [Ilumatobacter sp.]|nr:ELWxxDGT repeat protein [Ilumatobacter sp.]